MGLWPGRHPNLDSLGSSGPRESAQTQPDAGVWQTLCSCQETGRRGGAGEEELAQPPVARDPQTLPTSLTCPFSEPPRGGRSLADAPRDTSTLGTTEGAQKSCFNCGTSGPCPLSQGLPEAGLVYQVTLRAL